MDEHFQEGGPKLSVSRRPVVLGRCRGVPHKYDALQKRPTLSVRAILFISWQCGHCVGEYSGRTEMNGCRVASFLCPAFSSRILALCHYGLFVFLTGTNDLSVCVTTALSSLSRSDDRCTSRGGIASLAASNLHPP